MKQLLVIAEKFNAISHYQFIRDFKEVLFFRLQF